MAARLGPADFSGAKFLLLPSATLKTPPRRRTCLSYQSVVEHSDCCRDSEYLLNDVLKHSVRHAELSSFSPRREVTVFSIFFPVG